MRPNDKEALAAVLAGQPATGALRLLQDPRPALAGISPPQPNSRRRHPRSEHGHAHEGLWRPSVIVVSEGSVAGFSPALLDAWAQQVRLPEGWRLERWQRGPADLDPRKIQLCLHAAEMASRGV